MRGAAAYRGQPILLLAALLCGWCGLRVALWDDPFAREAASEPSIAASTIPRAPGPARVPVGPGPLAAMPLATPDQAATFLPLPAVAVAIPPEEPPAAPLPPDRKPPLAFAGSGLLLALGLSQIELPAALLDTLRAAQARPYPAGLAAGPPARPAARRWTADGWVLLRRDRSRPLVPGAPAYGRSQAGAVLRYRLDDSSAHRPQAHLRVSAALSGAAERELAAGLSARPLAALPLRVAAEMRLTDIGGHTDPRPAAFAVSEIAPIALPLASRAEIYLQAGYVGGDFATPFADGQVRVEKSALRLGGADLAAGLGAWGGAQEGASRLDLGPSGAFSFRLGDLHARLAADYRFRVAGDALPASGPSLTLSAGF